MQTLECIPNLSEGIRPKVIARMADAAQRPGVRLLDRSSDADHNRTVLTLAGEPGPLIEAIVALGEVAAREIDLRQHRGVHPRIGALDVVPFVPLGDSTMEDAVRAAQAAGNALAEALGLPVFLYEEAARSQERRNLATVRRGGFENLAARLAAAEWSPDYGPARPHPSAGASAVGARFFLIAFNAVLDTPDLSIARRIARSIRTSSGGLPALKAIGVPLRSRARAQVSMNLTDFRQTGLREALGAVEDAARELGSRVEATELIGLVPEAAVIGLEAADLLLPELSSAQILERRLEELA